MLVLLAYVSGRILSYKYYHLPPDLLRFDGLYRNITNNELQFCCNGHSIVYVNDYSPIIDTKTSLLYFRDNNMATPPILDHKQSEDFCLSTNQIRFNNSSPNITPISLGNIVICYGNDEKSYSDTSDGNLSENASDLIIDGNQQLNDDVCLQQMAFINLLRDMQVGNTCECINLKLDAQLIGTYAQSYIWYVQRSATHSV